MGIPLQNIPKKVSKHTNGSGKFQNGSTRVASSNHTTFTRQQHVDLRRKQGIAVTKPFY
jgi:hypothetical protein